MVFFTSLTLMILSIALWLWYIGGFSRYIWFRPMTVFWFFYMLQILLPSLYVYKTTGWEGDTSMAAYPIIVTASPLFVLLGAVMLSRFPKQVWERWWSQPLIQSPADSTAAVSTLVFGITLLALHMVLVGGNVPLLQMITGSLSGRQLSQSREEALKLLPFGVSYLIRWNIQVILPFASLTLMVMWLNRRTGFVLFLVAAFFAAFQAMFSVARSPVAVLMMKFIALYFMVTRRKIRLIWIVASF